METRRRDRPSSGPTAANGSEAVTGYLPQRSQPLEVTRRYRPGTLMLETEFRTETCTVAGPGGFRNLNGWETSQ